MSELAAAYYQERNERLHVDAMPALLDGEPRALLTGTHESNFISLQLANPNLIRIATDAYAYALQDLTFYLLQCAISQDQKVRMKSNHRLLEENGEHIDSMVVGGLFPGYLRAGRLYDIQLEAISRDEVDQTVFERATVDNPEAGDARTEDRSAFLMTSAMIHSGGQSLGNVAYLTVAYANRTNGVGLTTHLVGAPFSQNDLLARSALWQARANRTALDEYGVGNMLVQPVSRGTAGQR